MQDGVLRESGPGVGLARDRGAAMLGAFVEGLGTGDVRSTRGALRAGRRDHLGVAFVRFRECGASSVVADIDPALAVTKVSSGGRTFALELPRPTRAAQDQALARARVDGRPDRRHRRRDRAHRRLPRRGGDAGRSRRQPAARLEPAGPGRAPADRPGRAHRLHGADRRRERRRQGAGRAADPRVEPPPQRGPFVAVNCAAIVETLLEAELFGIEDRTATGVRGRRGKFEQADGGTLFLDEVSDLSLSAQAKLLRAIQDLVGRARRRHRTHDASTSASSRRPIAACRELVDASGSSARDLYLPAERRRHLRCRRCASARDDILELARAFPRAPSRPAGRAAVRRPLPRRCWPTTGRATCASWSALIERAVTLAEARRHRAGRSAAGAARRLRASCAVDRGQRQLRAWASRYARLVLERCDGNKREACRVLDISYHTLQAYLRYTPQLRAAQKALPAAATTEPQPDPPGGESEVVAR